MKTNLLVVTIALIVVLTACATLMLPSEDRQLAREFDKISLTADDIKFVKNLGLDPSNLSGQDKSFIMREAEIEARCYAH